jgi:hypothetical protein
LGTQVAAAKQLAGMARAAAPSLMVPVDQLTPETFALMKKVVEDIEEARSTGNREVLTAIEKGLGAANDLPAPLVQSLKDRVATARAALPALEKGAPGSEQLDQMLSKLSGVSRWHIQFEGINTRIVSGGPPDVSTLKPVDDAPVRTRTGLVRFENQTSYNVAYSLHGSSTYSLGRRGDWRRQTLSFADGATPYVRVFQRGGGYRDYTVRLGGSYAFRLNSRTGIIENQNR